MKKKMSHIQYYEKEDAEFDWQKNARPSQKLPPGDWQVWLILAGRGFGKTRTGAESIRQWVLSEKCRSVALVAHSELDARQVMVEGHSGLLSVHRPSERPSFYPSIRELHWPNGAKGRIFSAEAYERLRGPQFDGAWVDELAKFSNVQDVWDQLMFSNRIGKNPQVVVTTTPKPLALLRSMVKDPYTIVTRGNSYENIANLSPSFVHQVLDRYKDRELGSQEIFGEILEEDVYSLFRRQDICYLE